VSDLTLCRVSFREACAFIDAHHRHHKRPTGYVVAIGAMRGGELVGVAMLGRPVARNLDDGRTLEVLRLCVPENEPNVCSWLLTRAKRAAQALGCRAITYTLEREGGASL
jgi:hypothetical protein